MLKMKWEFQGHFREIKSGINALRNRDTSQSRPILYLLVLATTFFSLSTCNTSNEIRDAIHNRIPRVQEDVIGKEGPYYKEEFVELNGKRFYSVIDGKPVEKLFSRKKSPSPTRDYTTLY